MLATDLGPDVIIRNFSEAYIQKRYRNDGFTEANLYKLCRAIYNGFLKESGEVIEILGPQRFPVTATQGFLDHHADYWNVPRRVEEGDGSLRLRIGQVKLVKWGAFNIDQMLTMLATLLQTDAASIEFSENVDEDGNWEPNLITFNINPDVFLNNEVDDVAGAVEDLNADMEKVAPAGVRVIVTTAGTAKYDDGVTVYDDGFTYS